MHGAHRARKHRAVAHAGVEQAQCRRPWVDVGEFHADPLGDDPLLAAGGDEQQVFLAIVVEAEVVRGAGRRRLAQQASGAGMPFTAPACSPTMKARTRFTVSLVTRPPRRRRLDQLAVVDRQPPEGGFRHAGAAAEFGDVAQERFAQWTTSRMSLAAE